MNQCQHPQVVERRRRKSNGAIVVTPQCLICGWAAPEVSKQGKILAKLDWFDESIAVRWAEEAQREAQLRYEERQRQWKKDYKNHSGKWWDAYKDYLRSDHWHWIRELVFKRSDRGASYQVRHIQ